MPTTLYLEDLTRPQMAWLCAGHAVAATGRI